VPTLAAVAAGRAALRRSGHARSPACQTAACECGFGSAFRAPFPHHDVRMTSIYSKGDGVVCWRAQRVAYADCVEVTGSHVGLMFNRKSYRVLADALAKKELHQCPTP
jgi:hypothetical protein